ncbi:MAG: hypothetical protein KGR98_05965 [Verrucomicrobia bacterium]|nr:hypothetical protein [Verrucomicrobiota bacterium]MDE3100386.1 hypothetical protein [Verrucomicrobiota bacterium]
MKFRLEKWLWLAALAAILAGASGCASQEPDNTSARPWDSPQGWENASPMINPQQEQR